MLSICYHLPRQILLELPPSLLQGPDISISAESTCSSKFHALVVRDSGTVVAPDPRLILETCFSSHPEDGWTERHTSCGTEAKQNTGSGSSPRIKTSQVCLKLVRWIWLKCTWHLRPFSHNFTSCYPCQVLYQKYHSQTRCRYLFWSDYRNVFGSGV